MGAGQTMFLTRSRFMRLDVDADVHWLDCVPLCVVSSCCLSPTGYAWWSMFHAMPALVFFFPLCQMGPSGYEVLSIVWFSPLLTLIGPIRRGISTPTGLLITRMLSIVGVASFLASTLLLRLTLLAAGNFFIMLVLVGSWWNMSKLDR